MGSGKWEHNREGEGGEGKGEEKIREETEEGKEGEWGGDGMKKRMIRGLFRTSEIGSKV